MATTRTVTNTVVDATNTPVPGVYVEVLLLANNEPTFVDDSEIVSRVVVLTGADGIWTLSLVPNSEIDPANTYYQVTHRIPGLSDKISAFIVPDTSGTHSLVDLLTAPPDDLPARASLIDFSGLPTEDPHIENALFLNDSLGPLVLCISAG